MKLKTIRVFLLKTAIAGLLFFLCAPSTLIAQTSIVGGEPAEAEEFPWMVTLVTDVGIQGCGASLIHPEWVLTAAHCIPDFNGAPENIQVLINSLVTNPNNIESYSELIDIEEIIIHPNWDWFEGGTDLALIRLAEPALTAPVLLATEEDSSMYEHGMPAIALGWGITETGGNNSDVLLKANTSFVGPTQCIELYETTLYATSMELYQDSLICAAFVNEDSEVVGAALGDSGGPLVFEEGGIYKQVGVVSFGESDVTLEEFPGVFVLVPAFIDWINTTIEDSGVTSTLDYDENVPVVRHYANQKLLISNLNPAESYKASIYSTTGQLVSEKIINHSHEQEINILGYDSGIYIVHITSQKSSSGSQAKFAVVR